MTWNSYKTLFFIIISITTFGQKTELNRVTKDELLEKQCKTDTSASAAFLFKKAKTTFKYYLKEGFVSITEFQIKLKIYKKEGLQWANFKMPYYVGYEKLNDESINIESAFTYNLENDKIVKSKVTTAGKFEEQINEYWKVKTLSFPNVRECSIIELKYSLKTENISTLPIFQFQYEIPVNTVEYLSEIPEFYIYRVIKNGFVDIQKEEKIENTSQFYEGEHNLTTHLSYKQITAKYSAQNIPAIKDESYINNIDNYTGAIDHELQIIRMPGEEPKQISSSWEAVAKSIYENQDFNLAVSTFDYFSKDIKALLTTTLSVEDKTKKIFNFVKMRMNWNKKYSFYPQQKIEVAYSEKVGNVGEINLMLVAMLRLAGVDADPVLVSTRDNGFALFPNKSRFNYVIVAAKIENKIILMDATDKFSDLNRLPIRALNWAGRLIKRDGTNSEINLMPNSNSKKIIYVMGSITKQGEVSGKIRSKYFDYNALLFREKNNGIATDNYIEQLEKKNIGLEITEYDVQNNNGPDLTITENYSFKTSNSVEVIGDKMYVAPFLFFTTIENPFKQETREYPVDFIFPRQDKFIITLKLPEGFIIETIPESKALIMPEDIGKFKYNIGATGNQIQLHYTFDVNKSIISSDYYDTLKKFFKEIVEKQTEKIVLKKL